MGKVTEKIKLTSLKDIHAVEFGIKNKKDIRSVVVEGLADTGATLLVLPEDIAKKIGLKKYREAKVTYADNRQAKKGVARGIMIEILNRTTEVECVIEKEGTKTLIGQIPLEALDLYVDCKKGRLVPRPESPDMPMIDLF
ncbi:MAG: clan AA aspartic protease [Cytophagales bacterium]|nr:clan AA aspartic protease [Cytophagales bacterium]